MSVATPNGSGSLEDRTALARRLSDERGDGGDGPRVVLANGCFDLLHVGHVRYLQGAADLGDRLVVALNSDRSIAGLKGEGRPLMPLADRAEIIASLACVDHVIAFDEPNLEETLRILRPDVHAKGTDYTVETVPERAVDEECGIEIAICGDPKTHSSGDLLERMRDGE